MATKQQLENQLTRCEEEILDTCRASCHAQLMHDSEAIKRTEARLYALKILESQLHAAWRRTPL
jgi:hypothetical protein